jgi:glycerophosphoryl diester phosphodiesterase
LRKLKQYDAGSWFSPEFAGERIPTAEEVMLEAKGRMILYFDLKVPGRLIAIMNDLDATGFNPDDCWFLGLQQRFRRGIDPRAIAERKDHLGSRRQLGK